MAIAIAALTSLYIAVLLQNAAGQQQIPVDVQMMLGGITSNQEFIQHHITQRPRPPGSSPDETPEEDLLFTETGSLNPGGVDQIADMMVTGDHCEPRDTTIPVSESSELEPGVIYFPQCTRVHRCGGCCGGDVLECVPTAVERQNAKVMKARYPLNQPSGSDIQFEFEGIVDVQLEKHLACRCQCRVQPQHCTPGKHIYNQQACTCQCINHAEALRCPAGKVWDETECACVCPRIPNCLHDEFFNFATCSCQRGVLESEPAENPCAGVRCRPGWHPVQTSDGRCVCRISRRRRGRGRRRHQ